MGGYSFFSYKQTQRGYYVCVMAVERRECAGGYMEGYSLFGGDGIKQLVIPVDRQSKKAEASAMEMYESTRDALMALPRFDKWRVVENEHKFTERAVAAAIA